MSCLIKLDNYQGKYYPGDIIRGTVICSLDKTVDIRGVEVKLEGKERVQYINANNARSLARNTFLKSQHILEREGNFGPGTFEYSFSFQLPTDLPSSYHGPYGDVYFTIKAKVDIPFDFDYTDKKTVNVKSPINLNIIASDIQLRPICYLDEKTLCCFCCESGPITMEVHLEKEAFIIGEVVKINVVINNMTDEDVEKVVAKLNMVTAVLMNGSDLAISTNVALGHIPVLRQGPYNPVEVHPLTSTNQIPSSASPYHSPTPSNQAPPPYPPFAPPGFHQTPTSVGEIGFILPKDMNVPPYPSNPVAYPPTGSSAPPPEAFASTPPSKRM